MVLRRGRHHRRLPDVLPSAEPECDHGDGDGRSTCSPTGRPSNAFASIGPRSRQTVWVNQEGGADGRRRVRDDDHERSPHRFRARDVPQRPGRTVRRRIGRERRGRTSDVVVLCRGRDRCVLRHVPAARQSGRRAGGRRRRVPPRARPVADIYAPATAHHETLRRSRRNRGRRSGSARRTRRWPTPRSAPASHSNVPIVAERTMWWPGPTAATWRESHAEVGATDERPAMGGRRHPGRCRGGWLGHVPAGGDDGAVSRVHSGRGVVRGRQPRHPRHRPLGQSNHVVDAPRVPADGGTPLCGNDRVAADARHLVAIGALVRTPIVVEKAMYLGADFRAGGASLATRLPDPP